MSFVMLSAAERRARVAIIRQALADCVDIEEVAMLCGLQVGGFKSFLTRFVRSSVWPVTNLAALDEWAAKGAEPVPRAAGMNYVSLSAARRAKIWAGGEPESPQQKNERFWLEEEARKYGLPRVGLPLSRQAA